jgi:hypothetical protein
VRIDTRIAAEVLLVADHVRLKQVLLNLLSNAVKYNVPGGCVVVRGTPQANGSLRMEIQDSGMGLGPERLASIFSPFERLGHGSQAGSGIGLMITRRLVALMQGEIGVFSEPGRGSVFWVELPQQRLTVLENMLQLTTAGQPAASAARAAQVTWIGAEAPLYQVLQRLQTLRPALRMTRVTSPADCPAAPGLVLATAQTAAEYGLEPPMALKGARVLVVMGSEGSRNPAATATATRLSTDCSLPALLELLDSL